MKVNFNIPIQSYKGEPIKLQGGDLMPIKDAICRVLSSVTFGTDQEKVRIAELSRRIWVAPAEIEITKDEADLIKRYCKEMPAVLFEQIYKLFETK